MRLCEQLLGYFKLFKRVKNYVRLEPKQARFQIPISKFDGRFVSGNHHSQPWGVIWSGKPVLSASYFKCISVNWWR